MTLYEMRDNEDVKSEPELPKEKKPTAPSHESEEMTRVKILPRV